MLKGFHRPSATTDKTAQPVVPDHRLVVFWNALTSNHHHTMPSFPSSSSSSSSTATTSSTSFPNDCSHIQTFTNDLLRKSWMVLRPRNALPEKNNVPNKKPTSNKPETVLQQQEGAVDEPGGEQKFETMAIEEKESTSQTDGPTT